LITSLLARRILTIERSHENPMKRITVTIAIILSIAVAALAQQPRGPRPQNGPGGPGGPGGPPPVDLVKFLGLTADQKTQFDALHDALRTQIDPLFEQKKAADDQLHSLMESANPDPTALGKQMLAIHAIDEQIKAAHETTEAKMAALLNADQKVKFQILNELRHSAPR